MGNPVGYFLPPFMRKRRKLQVSFTSWRQMKAHLFVFLQFGCVPGLRQNWLEWPHNFPSSNESTHFHTELDKNQHILFWTSAQSDWQVSDSACLIFNHKECETGFLARQKWSIKAGKDGVKFIKFSCNCQTWYIYICIYMDSATLFLRKVALENLEEVLARQSSVAENATVPGR